jgi:hypothetical protein
MTATQIGTVLPTRESLARADAHAAKMARGREAIGQRTLPHCERRVVGGEVRYYDTIDQYAVVSRQGAVLWFQVREDGDYRI